MTQDFSKVPDKTKNYLFISNHRDIVMDPALLSVAIIDAGWENTTEIAIGDNLLAYPWIKRLVRILKAFIVLINVISPFLLSCWGFFFAFGCGVYPHSCSSATQPPLHTPC